MILSGVDLLATLTDCLTGALQFCLFFVYFFTTANVADVKLETDIVEKRFFMVKEKTTYYTGVLLLWSFYDRKRHVFVINDFLRFWLKRYFTCKLRCMLLATAVVLK